MDFSVELHKQAEYINHLPPANTNGNSTQTPSSTSPPQEPVAEPN